MVKMEVSTLCNIIGVSLYDTDPTGELFLSHAQRAGTWWGGSRYVMAREAVWGCGTPSGGWCAGPCAVKHLPCERGWATHAAAGAGNSRSQARTSHKRETKALARLHDTFLNSPTESVSNVACPKHFIQNTCPMSQTRNKQKLLSNHRKISIKQRAKTPVPSPNIKNVPYFTFHA